MLYTVEIIGRRVAHVKCNASRWQVAVLELDFDNRSVQELVEWYSQKN